MKMNMTPRAKKLLAGLTAAALTLSMLPATALAAKDYATGGETALRFSNSGITVQEGDYDGYKIDGTELTINAAGTYVLSGSCADGSVTVKKGTTGVVLVLDGLTLTCGDSAAIACNKSTEVTIVAADGTVNTLADTEQNNDETYPDNDSAENAVIKCKDGSQVTLCGSGTLNVTANGKNGVKSGATTDEEGAASLTIRELTLNIDAPVNDAVNAEQQLNIESGSLTISAGDDALHCDLSLTVGASGTAGPDIDITGCYEGIEAANLAIRSGDIDITATDDCLNAANSDLTGYSFTMDISGSTINAYTSGGDGFDSNGSLTISGGVIAVWTANTALTRGMLVTILYQMAGAPEVTGTCPFRDVAAGSYYEKAAIWAAENGLVSGYENGCFGPNDPVTREQLAAILYRYAQYRGLDVSQTGSIGGFADNSSVSGYARTAMAWANGAGLISGMGDNTLAPRGQATRGQAAVILMGLDKLAGL